MEYRTLGRTGLQVSRIGFGAWGIGKSMWGGGDDAQALKALHLAVEKGINFFDTALAYGHGHSERLIGKFVSECSSPVIVATKVPPLNRRWPAEGSLEEVFPAKHVRECAEQSLRNLGRDCIDLLQLHVWNPAWIKERQWMAPLEQLRREGKIRFLGVSVNDHDPESALSVVRSGQVDTVQVIFNIFDQSPLPALFPACDEAGVGVIARVPFDEGALTGEVRLSTQFSKKDWRNHYFRLDRRMEIEQRVKKLHALLGDEVSSLPELALRFCLQPPEVDTVIPGMRKPSHVAANAAVAGLQPLSDRMIEALRNHAWQKNFYV